MARYSRLLALFLVVVLVFAIGQTAVADSGPFDPVAEAERRMKALGLVQGRPDGLAANLPITRAEFVTVIVRALGREGRAAELFGTQSFDDVSPSHWASGYVAAAQELIRQ